MRRSPSKNVTQLPLFRRGGRRDGAGRKPAGERALVAHASRARVTRHTPVFVTTKLVEGLPNLRRERTLALLRDTLTAGADRFGFRLVEYSIQSDQCVQKGRRVQQESDLSGQEPPPCSSDGEPTRDRRLEAHRRSLRKEGEQVVGP